MLLYLAAACSRNPARRPELPAIYGDYRQLHNKLVFELPDSGGYLVNGTPLDTARLPNIWHQDFDLRPPNLRAAFVVDNPKRPWRDVEFLITSAQTAGVQLFDADRSSKLKGFEVTEPANPR